MNAVTGILIAFVGGAIILGLAIKIALLNARIDGYQTGVQQTANHGVQAAQGGFGCLQMLAIVGFIAICGICILLGTTV
jgi:hypothetical protein